MKTKIFSILTISFLLISCNASHQEKEEAHQHDAHNEHQETQDVEHNEAHQHLDQKQSIALNNGEKWIVNEEMKPFVIKGEQLVNDYIANNNSDYKELANQIKNQNKQLISSCTMDGKSHEELHEWLHPHLEIVKELSETDSDAKAAELVTSLEKSYQLYHQYFN